MGGTSTRSEAKKRSKLVVILLAPFTVLRKAGNFYMKFVADCSDMVGNDYNGMVGGPTAQMSTLPKSFSSNSMRESSIGYSASGRRSGPLQSASGRRSGQLQSASGRRSGQLQSASGRRSGVISESASGRRSGVISESASGRRSHEKQPDMHYREAGVLRRESTMRYSDGMALRSYSVGIGKIGKIEEEKPCSFREDDEDDKVDVFPRSRSQAVTRHKGAYY